VRVEQPALSLIVVVLAIAVIALAIWLATVHRSLAELRGRLRAIRGTDGEALDAVLGRLSTGLDRADERIGALNSLQKELETLLRKGTIRNVGLVRFNPFPDAGGDLSFVIALLDAEGTGLVLSSLHARTDTRLFAKPVQGGRSTYPLSDEEQDAIRRALSPAERSM
jgi:uncharacterized protein DUF4446